MEGFEPIKTGLYCKMPAGTSPFAFSMGGTCEGEIVAVLTRTFINGLGARAWCERCGLSYEITWVENELKSKKV